MVPIELKHLITWEELFQNLKEKTYFNENSPGSTTINRTKTEQQFLYDKYEMFKGITNYKICLLEKWESECLNQTNDEEAFTAVIHLTLINGSLPNAQCPQGYEYAWRLPHHKTSTGRKTSTHFGRTSSAEQCMVGLKADKSDDGLVLDSSLVLKGKDASRHNFVCQLKRKFMRSPSNSLQIIIDPNSPPRIYEKKPGDDMVCANPDQVLEVPKHLKELQLMEEKFKYWKIGEAGAYPLLDVKGEKSNFLCWKYISATSGNHVTNVATRPSYKDNGHEYGLSEKLKPENYSDEYQCTRKNKFKINYEASKSKFGAFYRPGVFDQFTGCTVCFSVSKTNSGKLRNRRFRMK